MLWFTEGLIYVITMCIPLVLMEIAFNDLDDVNTILVDELLTYKGKSNNGTKSKWLMVAILLVL